MSLLKKLIYLLIFFFLLNIFSIYGFDYKGYLSKNEPITLTNSNDEYSFINQINEFKNKIFDSFQTKKEVKTFNLVLVKKDGLVEMNGLFANKDDAKKISDILNINREGEYKYEENRLIDEYLLDDLVLLVTPLKDFFADNSKLSLIDNKVILSGELKDPNYKDLLDSILSRVKIDLKTDIVIPQAVEISQLDKSITDNGKTFAQDGNLIKFENNKNIGKENSSILPLNNDKNKNLSNTASKKNDIQLEINNLLSSKKINFERRSTKITEDSNSVVKEIAKILTNNQNFRIEVAGHTDSRGSNSLNKEISQDRASSVREVLISLGIDKDRVTAVGYGEEFPIAQDDENGLSEINRRVEFNILGE
ncbi:MAG: OmpA family protein [Aliarcobacter sp.]|jgi:outer membrane protein OmpA-like peptidoglycan-associated protein|nr:OmpA family protein [Aliarcobacter sp.]